jgi:hypothetical protein
MTDMIKEYVPFKDAITAGPLVEAWLAQIEKQMILGLYVSTKRSFTESAGASKDNLRHIRENPTSINCRH